ncbi:Uncharacterised protein [Mycobacteroides abscessus subsp. abscessus]|nr:Uncharacterised protein [Mycobacteroides abscessus subsp. abscessus]
MQRLLLEQLAGQVVQDVAVLRQHVPRLGVGGLDELADLVVDVAGDLVTEISLRAHGAAQEGITVLGAVADGAQLGAHAELGDHGAGDLGGVLDVGHRAGRGLAEDQLLGGAAADRHDQARDQFGTRLHALVVLGDGDGVPAGAATGQDRHLVHGVQVRHGPAGQRVPGLVVGGDLLFQLADDAALATGTTDDAVDGLFQCRAGDHGGVLAGGQQRGLVDDIGQVGAGHADGPLGQAVEVGVGGDGLARRVHPQHGLAAGQVGRRDRDLPVEAAGTQQRRVQDVGPVGGGDQDDALAVAEAVHFDEQLVQRLLALVVAAAQAGATLAADGVDLVDEDDAGAVLLGLLEQVAHAGGTDTDEHFDEVRTGDGEERHPGLTGHGAGQQRLTGSGRAVEQHAFGDLGAQGLVAAGVLQEVLDLVELFDGLVHAGDVGERRLRHVLAEQLGLGLAEAEAHAAAALHTGEHEKQADEQQ